MNVSIRELKTRLLECLRCVQTGEDILITADGKPLARLVQANDKSVDPEAMAIARLRAQPWIRPGNGGKPHGSDGGLPKGAFVIIGGGEE